MQAQVKLPPKRGRAYRCLKGDDFVGERGKVISHIYKMHLPLDQSPYFCTLCTFRCMKLEQLATHVSAYKDHIDRVRRAEESGEEVDEAIHLKESTCPYIVADGLDMERLSADESNSLWQQRAGQRFKNNTVSKAVQPLPAPQPVTAICVPTAAPVTTTTSEPSATEVTVVEAMPDNLSLWSFLNSPAEIQEPPSAIIPPAVEETQKRHSRSQSRSRSRSPESSASSDSCRDQMVKLTQAVVEIVRDNREQMIIFAKAIDDLTAAIRQQNELLATVNITRYLYTDDITMDGANVMGLLYVSSKYDVKTLEQKCLTYLPSLMTPDNACVILEQAHLFDEQELKEKALTCILANGDAALQSTGVTDLSHECLAKIIQAEELEVDEQSVFEAVVAWSETACRKQNKDVTHENRRQMLGEAIKQVRFPLLDHRYLVKHIIPTNLLTDAEKLKIFANCLCPNENISPFNANKRTGTIRRKNITIQRLTKNNKHDMTSSNDHSIVFSVNQHASLQGFWLYGPSNSSTAHYHIRAFITDPEVDDVIEGSSMKTSVETSKTIYDVTFPRPLKLRKDKVYNLIVNLDGPDSHRGMWGKSTVQHGSFVCSFFNRQESKHSNKLTGCTGVDAGQIPGLMFLV
ncbi:BTB/POZ domain-containing protein 6-like [Gigantopelta aegis]|uniref:BTB/POZ domain-containing protein 6-like n=1 Tax=Gigantopelta aegis TaxID=1735272 RepID=UPI001B88A8D0|nr:BTB/POZ domain-containing protein 6-like [Gigantopelta aegis]